MQDQIVDAQAFRAFEHTGWQKAAHPYHNYFANITNKYGEYLLEAANIKSGIDLLDIATGPGYVATKAAARGAKAIGVDFSSAMLSEARQLYPTLDFREGDAENLPFPDESFDAVVVSFGMLHFSRPELALAEIYRVLRPTGHLAFTVWAKPEEALGLGIVLNAIQTHGSMNVPLPPGPPFFRFSDPQECSQTLQAIGFTPPTVVQISQSWSLPSPDALFDAFFEGGARTGPLLRAQSAEALDTIRTVIRDTAKTYEKDGIIEIPMPAVLTSAMKP